MAIANDPLGSIPGVLVVALICMWMYKLATKAFLEKSESKK
jgi:hypothetical protein